MKDDRQVELHGEPELLLEHLELFDEDHEADPERLKTTIIADVHTSPRREQELGTGVLEVGLEAVPAELARDLGPHQLALVEGHVEVEVGDPDRPELVFFFDEAHLLFDDAPAALVDKVEQVARLIRSKGVGVFFVTQYPSDVPEEVIGQLGNRIQHALRAFTPRDRKALRAAAETFRANPAFDTEAAIGELGVGEALVSTLDAKGVPSVVERTLIAPPRSRVAVRPDRCVRQG